MLLASVLMTVSSIKLNLIYLWKMLLASSYVTDMEGIFHTMCFTPWRLTKCYLYICNLSGRVAILHFTVPQLSNSFNFNLFCRWQFYFDTLIWLVKFLCFGKLYFGAFWTKLVLTVMHHAFWYCIAVPTTVNCDVATPKYSFYFKPVCGTCGIEILSIALYRLLWSCPLLFWCLWVLPMGFVY